MIRWMKTKTLGLLNHIVSEWFAGQTMFQNNFKRTSREKTYGRDGKNQKVEGSLQADVTDERMMFLVNEEFNALSSSC